MSGRQDRGRGRRTRYDRRNYEVSSGRQPGSNRFGNDTPPRFAHRQRNGDGYYYEDGGGGGGGRGSYSGKGRHDRDGLGWGGGGGRQHSSAPKSSYDDLMQVLGRLENSTDVDGSCRLARHLLDILEAADHKTMQMVARNADGILKSLENAIFNGGDEEKELVVSLEQCIGQMGKCLGRDIQRLYEWVFSHCHSEEVADSTKAVFIGGLYEVLSLDSARSQRPLLQYVAENLQMVLEMVEKPALLEAVIKNIITLSQIAPPVFAQHFKNTVDILVGWHIDTQQKPSLISYISSSLVTLRDFWVKEMNFSVEILKQFLEDMEAYSNELSGISNDMSVPPEESSTPEQCLSKLTALIKVFTTVLSALGTTFSPSRCADLTPGYVQNLIARIIEYILSANDILFSEDLLISGNKCIKELCHCLQNHAIPRTAMVAGYIIQQLEDLDVPSQEVSQSVLSLITQLVEDLQGALPTQFIQGIFSQESPILQLRYTASSKLLNKLVKLYQCVLSIRNIPLLETMYQLIVSDVEDAFSQLEQFSGRSPVQSDQEERQFNLPDTQSTIIFDLVVLSQLSNTCKDVIGMWSPTPSVFALLVSQLDTFTSTLAGEYPAIHHALLYALYQDCHNNGYYIPGAGGTSVSVGGASVSSTHSQSGTVSEVLTLLVKQTQFYTLSFDSCRLIQRWVDYMLGALLSANSEAVAKEKIIPLLDNLTCQLLAFTFSREHSIRLENAAVLKALFQSEMISDSVIMKCVPECLMRLCDTRGEIRAAYSALLEVVPTHILTSFSGGIDTFQPPNGRKGVEGIRSCRGTWHARRVHMTKQSQVTFHGHHFKAIMGFIMHGYAPSKHLPDDWLERMYHSCQHRQPPIPESRDHPEQHPQLMSHMVCNCDAVLWFWATYESAQYCLLARLRTPLGMPPETFAAIETVLRGYAQEVESHDRRHLRDTPSSFSGHMGAGLGPRHYTVHLRAVLLLQFMEHLDKLMYNAYEGSCVTLPPVPKSVRTFFRKNMDTCLGWLGMVRNFIVPIALHAGMPGVAVRHGFAALKVLAKSQHTLDFWKMLVQVVQALLMLGSWEAIRGLGVWVKNLRGQTPPWIMAAEAQAKSCYETACEDYIKALDLLRSSEEPDLGPAQKAPINGFIVNKVCECYSAVSEWQDLDIWYNHVGTLQSQSSGSPELSAAFSIQYDLNQLRALSSFEEGDLHSARDYVDRLADSHHPSRDPEVFPLWDPSQLLSTSHTLLLKVATLQAGDEGSGSDDATSVTSEGESGPKSTMQRWLKLSAAYSESPLRVGCLEWPLRVSPTHALQLQAAAALRALHPIKSRHAQPCSSGLLLYSTPVKSLNPSRHDTGIWSQALRISSHILGTHPSEENYGHTNSLLLEAYRLARKQGNIKDAKHLVQRQIQELTGDMAGPSDLNLRDAMERMNSSAKVTAIEKLRIMRELAKLHAFRGQAGPGIDLMSAAIVNYTSEDASSRPVASENNVGSELTSRSLLSVVKWLQTDSRLLQSVWSSDHETGRRLQLLLRTEYDCRKRGHGLYMSSLAESFELFRPDDSVTRFDKHEYAVGQLLHLSTIHCPTLAKAWWALAGWCYRIGRKNLEALSGSGTAELLNHEQEEVDRILVDMHVTPEQRMRIISVLGQVHIADEMAEEDIKGKEQFPTLNMEEDTKSLKGQLLTVCPALEQLSSLDPLLGVWQGVRVRMFMHYQLSARAYFTFLKLSGTQPDSSPGLDDMNVTATLRLLRLLVKYAGELKAELEDGFATTPTKPWKGIIPQLFSRLNHPEANVRESVSDLLCRVGKDSPHFIIYPAIVGASRRAEKKTNVSGTGYLREEGERRDSDFDIGSRDFGENFSPPDTMNSDEENGEASPIELTNLEKCLSVIIDSLKQQNPDLVKAVEDLVAELCRITLLWDEMWLAALMQRQGEVHRRLMQIDQETKRTISIPFLGNTEKEAIMREKYLATMKPLLWVLEHLAAMTSQPPETPNERNFQAQYGETINSALQRLHNPVNYANPHTVWEPFKEFQQMLMHRAQKRMQNSLSLHEISPHLAAISSSCITMPGHNQGDEPVTLESFQLEVAVLPTKTKPKKISMIGSDGRKHTYLFKGLEDLHLDERIMQFMAIINNMFARAHKHQTQLYQAKDYAVIPLGARSGLIQWVDNVTPLFGIYKRWQQREAYAKAMQQQIPDQPNIPMPIPVMKPNELFYSKIIPLLKKEGMSEQTPRKDWPHAIQLRVLKELMNDTPSNLLAMELWCASTCASEWWSTTQTYSRSTAVMCMIGYIIGLGDRHLDNLLVEFSTGQVVHVDYNVCFEKGKSLRVPERVPFRMTQNIEAALGFTGVEGLFRISCEDILRILRRGRETLLTLLEAFVYDPLIDWTQSEDAAFPLAIRATTDSTGRPSRKDMEREVASGMLVTRLAESGTHWQRNRESLCSVLLALEHHLDEIASTGEKLVSISDLILRIDRQMDIFKDAVSAPDHPLISMQDKLSEQSKLTAEQKRLVVETREKLQEYKEWNVKYTNAFQAIHGAELGTLIQHIQQKPLSLGPPAHEPAVEFLESIHLNQNIETCDQLEDELLGMLQKRRVILNNALEALHQYRNITAQFHADYLKQSRSYLWEQCLEPLLEEDISRESLHKAVEEFDGQLSAGGRSSQLVKAVDSRLRKQIQELHIRCGKLMDRTKSVAPVELSKLEGAVNDANRSLHQFCVEKQDSGPSSLACFIITALCPLSRRWLFMEQTAQAARDRLSDLTSRDGDWFLDELCTMSGNVSQMNGLLEMCIRAMGHDLQPGLVFTCSVEAVKSVHKVYMNMQDLFNKFQSLVLPEAINYVLMEDESTLEMLEELASFRLTSYPTLPLTEALSRLAEDLLQATLKHQPADLTVTAAVEEMRNKLSSLLISPTEGDTEPPPMTSARVILNSLVGYLQKCESSVLHMLEVMEMVNIPEEWETVDIIKQTMALMCNTAGLSHTEELLYVHKAQAIVEFCMECRKLLKAFKLEINNPEEHSMGFQPPTPPGTPGRKSLLIPVPSEQSLGLPIRRYISESLICHVLGQPSYSLACLLVSVITEYLEVDLPVKQIPIEDLCKMVNDHYQTQLPMTSIQQARTLFSRHDVAWRECDKAKRLYTNLENCKQSLHRTRSLTARFQWLHEESLISPESHYPWVGPQRSMLLTTIKKVLSEQMATSLTSVLDRVNSQWFRISQRLQWAAGSNPQLNSTIDEFERAMNKRKMILQEEEDLYLKIYEYSEAVIHLESSHTRIPAQTTTDREMTQLLHRCADVTVKLQLCMEQLSQVSDILPLIELPEDGGPLTVKWMQSRLEELHEERGRIMVEKKANNTKLAKKKEAVLSELEKLRTLNRAHRKLMVEIWPHLTTLARLEEPPPPGQAVPGPRAFINLQNKFGEETKSFIQATQELIASDMSLTGKSTRTTKSRAEEFIQMRNASSNHRILAEALLGQLLSFTDQLFQGQSCANLKWNPPPKIDSIIPKSRSLASITSQTPGQAAEPEQQSKIYRSSQGIVRDKRTGKALQEQNSYAVGVWRRVKAKLDGRDPDPNYRMTVTEQVKFVIDEAISLDNLCQLYEGWTPWV